MTDQNIILTGFMGTGKSTIGRALAQRRGLLFVDTDQRIEEYYGRSVAEIFAQQGEAAFRRMEEELVNALAQQQNLVIATGGGLLTNPVNVRALQANGRIICLTATPEEILNRVKEQHQVRPLLQDPDPLQRITDLMHQRDAVYRQFPQVSTSGRTTDQVIEMVLNLLN